MAIRNLTPASVTQFIGKNTAQNLTDAQAGTLLSAKNILINKDNQIRKIPGYTLVAKTLNAGPVRSIFNFERAVDNKQFVFVHSGSEIFAMNPDGTGVQLLSSGETEEPFQFVGSDIICYGSNGVNAWRFVDNAGVLTKYIWGIAAPLTAPAIALSAGTLTLTFGRTYVVCGVSIYTDSLGIQRVHVGAPSPISAFTGPVTSQLVELEDIPVFTDPQVNFVWIFATTDSPINTSATFYFAAQITNGTTSFGDTLVDADLDQTRLAPFDNNPAPPQTMLTTSQTCVAGVQVNQMRISGGSTITLGIPEEAWPLDLFFNVPAGARTATAISTVQQGQLLVVDTLTSKFGYAGTVGTTFTEEDSIASPGSVGKFAQVTTPFGQVFLSESKRLFIWGGVAGVAPTEISDDITNSYPGTYGMEDLSAPDLSTAQLLWYSYGTQHFVVVIARTTDAPDKFLNWMQIWSIPVKGSQSSGQFTGTSGFFNQIGGLYQSDKIPNNSLSAAASVRVDSVPYLFLGDPLGNVYRFPDGFADNGVPIAANFSLPWSNLGTEAEKRFYWIDLFVQCDVSQLANGGPVQNFKVWAAVAASAEDTALYTQLELQLVPDPKNPSQYALRGNLQVDGLNVGKFIRIEVQLPDDLFDDVVLKMTVWHAPLYQGIA